MLYGHTARVWRARFLPGGSIVSVGEDATCRVWNTNGSTKSIFRGHRGKCVWSLAVSKSGKTVVGLNGGDFLTVVVVGLPCGASHCRPQEVKIAASGHMHWRVLL